MPSAVELLREGRTQELWQKCCGFIDLSLEEFMAIQRRLLLEQIELLNRCELGNKVMRGAKPRTVEEFRELVPITTYDDYVLTCRNKERMCCLRSLCSGSILRVCDAIPASTSSSGFL